MADVSTSSEYLTLGKIGAAYGVKGWVKVHSNTNPIDQIFAYNPLYLFKNNLYQEVTITNSRIHGAGLVAHIEGCDDRDLTQDYRHCELVIKREQLPNLSNDEYYWTDLEGLRVLNQQGCELGFIDHLTNTGANDIMVVKGDKEHWIPFIRNHFVFEINLDKKTITVDWESDF